MRAVPADGSGGDCPSSGVRITNDRGDAAMGLRVVGIHLENCGTADYHLNGYPSLRLLDEDRQAVTGVKILDGTASISPASAATPNPAPSRSTRARARAPASPGATPPPRATR